MMNDNAYVNAKGHVKLELYDEQGHVTFTKEKHNLVVLSANEIVGQAFADPQKMVKASQEDKGASELAPDANGHYVFNLSHQRLVDVTSTVDLGSAHANLEVTLPNATNIVSLKKVIVGETELVIGQDVFVQDEEKGILRFAVAPKNKLSVELRRVSNPYVTILQGSEVITVNGVAFTAGLVPSDADRKYAIDYETGKVFFETAKVAIVAKYNFKIRYALGFMGLGGKPEGHPDYKPVEFSNLDKMKVSMQAEFEGSRQLIQYPASIGTGEPEIEIFPTQPINKKVVTDVLVGTAATGYVLPSAKGRLILSLDSVVDVTDAEAPVDVTANVTLKDANTGAITVAEAFTADNRYEVKYTVREDVNHTYYTLSQGPVMELLSVTHEDLNNKVTEYKIANGGLEIGQGDVWLVNPNKGIVGFSTSPVGKDENSPAPVVETPGQLTFQYRINSGTKVQFVADFPKGVPGPVLTEQTEIIALNTGQSTYGLQQVVSKDSAGKFEIISVKKGTTELELGTDFNLSDEGNQIILNVAVATGESVSIVYKWVKETHEIYQVAMFAEQELGKMFNISGIGPVTKDKNTGMRITWSVTF